MGILLTVLEAIAAAEGRDVEDLEFVMQDWVDSGAVQRLVNQGSDTLRIQFAVPNHSVTITGASTVFVDGDRCEPTG